MRRLALRSVVRHTELARAPGGIDLQLRLITPSCPLYHALDERAASRPFAGNAPWWGFVWPGGWALAEWLTTSAAGRLAPFPNRKIKISISGQLPTKPGVDKTGAASQLLVEEECTARQSTGAYSRRRVRGT